MSEVVRYSRLQDIAVITIDHPPVNASSQSVRADLQSVLCELGQDPTITAVLLGCAGRTFMAGADIREFDEKDIPAPDPNKIHATLESFPVPTVAVLFGTVLGGGLELALSCHYRVASNTTSLGLPEVTLGLVPGSGGTQRLPRLIGVESALRMTVTGAPVTAHAALDMGLVDALFEDDLSGHALAFAQALNRADLADRVLAKRKISLGPQDRQQINACLDSLPALSRGGRAARACAELVGMADQPFDQGLRREREIFLQCRDTTESRALRHAFFAEREAGRLPGATRGTLLRPIETVGVVGAGTMGAGISMSFANTGIPTVLYDLNADSLSRAANLVSKTYQRLVSKGRISDTEAKRRIDLIQMSNEEAPLATADLIVEAVFEQMDIKQEIFRRLGAMAKPGAILASNTSSLDVNQLAQHSSHPADVLGMHFFSPANIMRLVEVVRCNQTAPDVLATVIQLVKRMGKVPVVSGVCFGFIGNRMLEGYLREVEFLLLEGASPGLIDGVLEEFGFAMGPCRMLDLAGVDVAAKVVLGRKASPNPPPDPNYRVVVQKLDEIGRLGQKKGIGFYCYEGGKIQEAPSMPDLMKSLAHHHHIAQRPHISASEILDRCLLPLIMEGYRILEEGIAFREGDIDTVWLNGYGFPRWRGGPMFYARTLGREALVQRVEAYATMRGNAFGYWDVPAFMK